MGMKGLPFIMVALYLRLRPTILCSFERISVCLGCRCMNAPFEPAEVGLDQSRGVGGDNGPSVPHTSSVFVA